MTDLVLINSPIQRYSSDYRPDYKTTAPLGLGYLGTIARNAGIETEIVDAEAEKLSVEEIAQRANNMTPNVVGINVASTNFEISLDILGQIDAPHKIIGGPHATLKGEELVGDHLVVKGEAEDVFVDVVRNPRTGVINAGRTENLDRLPFVDRTLFANDPYNYNGGREATISTVRGCPFSCVYCSVPTINGRKMRVRSVGNVMAEIRQLQTQGVDSVHFMDDIFNFDRTRVENFCDSLIGLGISWRDLSRAELMDDALLEKMKKSGCYRLAFGVESGTPRILDYIGKCSDLGKIKRVFRKCRELGIETKAFFTLGYPTETEDEIGRTIDFSLELGADEANYMVVRAFPGTPLYEEMKQRGFSDADLGRYEQFRSREEYVKYHVMNFRSLNGMPNERLDELVKEAHRRFYNRSERSAA